MSYRDAKGTTPVHGWHQMPLGAIKVCRGWAQVGGTEANRAWQSAKIWSRRHAPHLRVRQRYERAMDRTLLWLDRRAA